MLISFDESFMLIR